MNDYELLSVDCPKDSVTSQKASVLEVYPLTCREGTEW